MQQCKNEQEPRLLPVVELFGKEFVVDVESRQFRDVDDPGNTVNMHSDEGRKMVEEVAGTEWRVYRVDRGPMKGGEGVKDHRTYRVRVLFKRYSLLLTNFCDTMCNEQGPLGMLQDDLLKDSML